MGNFPSLPFSSLKNPPSYTNRACWGSKDSERGHRRAGGRGLLSCRCLDCGHGTHCETKLTLVFARTNRRL